MARAGAGVVRVEEHMLLVEDESEGWAEESVLSRTAAASLASGKKLSFFGMSFDGVHI